MNGARFAAFISIVLTIWTALHVYVFWRAASIPWVAQHLSRRNLILVAVTLWLSYPLARILEGAGLDTPGRELEFVGATWIGFLWLLFAASISVECLTLGGWLLPGLAPRLRGYAAALAVALSVISLVQGLRTPVIRDHEVPLAGLPREHDGLILVAISDLHLGTLIGRSWTDRLVETVRQSNPTLIVVVGDLVDGNVDRVQPLLPILRNLQAPMGVWAVTGNHEFYAGLQRSISLMEQAGFKVLRDQSAIAAPGLVIAGVDDLTARREFGQHGHPIETALSNRPPGALILLSHSPVMADRAAAAGTGLMLSGHTHNGQVWPFNFLVRLRYKFLGGRYQVGQMPLIVCRGTATWGPRMRLWHPCEILRIRLRSG